MKASGRSFCPHPPGATLTIDGKKVGIAPVDVPKLAAGNHLVKASLQGYGEERQTITLEAEQDSSLTIKMAPLTGLVLVHTDPTGADVQVDGADRGKTPLFMTDIPFGKHRIKLSIPGYTSKELDLAIDDRVPQKIVASLTSDSAKIVLDSDPTGAAVVLNGIDKGKTPCTLERIPAGDNNLEVTLEGHEPYVQTLKLIAGQDETITAVLKAIPAELSVVTIPPKATIYIDDQNSGESPLKAKSLPPGAYRVRAELKGYDTDARVVTLKNAQKLTEEFRMEKTGGTLAIATLPPGVKVTVDETDAGATVATKENAEGESILLQVDSLVEGKHAVQLSKKGYASKTITIDIEKGKTAEIHETLQRRFVIDCEVSTAKEVFRGYLVEKDPFGNIKLELKPGVFKVIPAKDVRTVLPVKVEPKPEAKPAVSKPAE